MLKFRSLNVQGVKNRLGLEKITELFEIRKNKRLSSSILKNKMALGPKESGEIIAKLASHVKIKDEGIEKLGKEVIFQKY